MLKELIDFLSNPLVFKAILIYWLFSAFTGALPSPDKFTQYVKSGGWILFYSIFFGFLHGVSGNLSRAAIAFKVPGAQPDDSKPNV